MADAVLPKHADVVVIGGGIVGCSTAFHLARNHKLNVILLEQNQLTSGSTWHAAGLIGQLRSSASITQVLKYSVELYKSLAFETGLQTGWKMTGCLRLARSQDRWTEFKRLATTARSFGMDMHLLSPQEAKGHFPLMNVDDLVGATFLPTDGQASPSDITQALSRGARMNGVRIFENTGVQKISVAGRRVVSLLTTQGEIYAEKVVNCAGMWSRQLGAMVGVQIPLIPVKHQYVITEKIAGLASNAPTIRDPDRRTYFKEEVGGLAFGGYEPNPIAWDVPEVPADFEFRLFDDDWEHFGQHVEQAIARIPVIEKTGIKKMINGPESFTPDGNFILGKAPELDNFFVGCGFNAFGIASGGGAGWVLADWVAHGKAPMDMWSVDIQRFSKSQCKNDFVRERTLEAYSKHYAVAYPLEEYETGRGQLVSPLYEVLKVRGAVMGSKLGWERANWFAPKGVDPRDHSSMGRPNWFYHVGEEHRAVRTTAGLFDQSSFGKFEVRGPYAERALNHLCANDISKPVGGITYTQLLNERGGIECDLSVMRIKRNHFYLVTGTGFRVHDFSWIREGIGDRRTVDVIDVTEQYATLALMGPNSRAILERAAGTVLTNEKLPFGHLLEIVMFGYMVRCARITYVGELGFELHVPIDGAMALFRALEDAGADHGMRLCGYRAIESLRLEKGYRAWSSDITPSDTPYEAGLGFLVKKDSKSFTGRDALLQKSNQPLRKLLTGFTTEREDVVLAGRETILRDGKFAGYLTSGGYGYTIGKPIGYGYVRNAEGVDRYYVMSGSYELVVASDVVKAKPFFGALHDPKNERVRS